MIVKEKLEDAFVGIKQIMLKEQRMNKTKLATEARSSKYYQKCFDRQLQTLGGKLASFLSTGNVVSSTGLDLMQVSGYTIVAERLNIFRYMSHFQSVHRGELLLSL
jgi:DNA-directed RNA polymerase I subunit RPA2